MKRFSELVVVEIAGSIAGGYAGKLLAGLGARVIKVEPPGGDPRRRQAHVFGRTSTESAYLDTGKESLVLDLGSRPGDDALAGLLSAADAVVESSSPGPLVPYSAGVDAPALVRMLISPFGLDGPYARFRSTAFTDYAAGGQMYLTGEAAREPLQGAGSQAEYAAGLHAFIGLLAAWRARETTGAGQAVEVSHMEVMASLHQWTSVRWTHGGTVQRRMGNRYDTLHPITIYPCRDGFVGVSASSEEQAQRFMAVTGTAEHHEDERFASGPARLVNADAFDALVLPWLLERTAAEIVDDCQAARVPVAPVASLLDLLDDPHLEARRWWKPLTVERRTLRFPGPPFHFSAHDWRSAPPPPLDAHAPLPPAPEQPSVGEPAPPPDGPLAGVRILDLTRVWAGPLATRILGDLGADVIKVEPTWGRPRTVPALAVRVSGRYPGNVAGERPWNREGMFNKFNRNKRAITLDLDKAEAKEVFERMVANADVVIENYSPRVMPQLGLGYERLRVLNPGLIYVGMPGYGWSGPYRDWVAFGTTLEPHAGLASMMGYRDSGPYKSGVAWADPVAAMHAAAAVMAALHDRAADSEGRGQAVELAQFEGMMDLVGEHFLEAQLTGSNPQRRGNRHAEWSPQGVYPCAGEDRWIALSITSDDDWRTLCAEAAFEDIARLTLDERRAQADAIDARIAGWTRASDHSALMHRLQALGIAAVALFNARELVENEHLRARGFWIPVTHADCGTIDFPGQPIRLSATPATFRLPAPGLGEHNREVLREVAGLSAEEIGALYALGVVADEPAV